MTTSGPPIASVIMTGQELDEAAAAPLPGNFMQVSFGSLSDTAFTLTSGNIVILEPPVTAGAFVIDLEGLAETAEILRDQETMRLLEEGRRDLERGQMRDDEDVRRA